MKTLLHTFAIFASLTLLGCTISYNNIGKHGAQVEGKVLDAKTRKPIENAKVAIKSFPETTAFTDAEGQFTTRPLFFPNTFGPSSPANNVNMLTAREYLDLLDSQVCYPSVKNLALSVSRKGYSTEKVKLFPETDEGSGVMYSRTTHNLAAPILLTPQTPPPRKTAKP